MTIIMMMMTTMRISDKNDEYRNVDIVNGSHICVLKPI